MSKPTDCHDRDKDGDTSEKRNPIHKIFTPSFLEALKNGEPAAYYRLVQVQTPKLMDFLFTVLRSREDAEEIAQDIFIHIWQKRENLVYENSRNIEGYMYTIARTRAIDRINERKKSKIHYTDQLTTPPDAAASPEEIVELKQVEKQIEQLVSEMPKMRRIIYTLKYEQGKTNDEIARELDLKPSTVRVHISIALKEIRDFLGSLLLFF
ncbi:MAG: sigma-70 family RNA polymerase sigma factor [Rikenellaceae bacterium]|nr:sigma-70 family RNA polymerase sigma factor [Rikenellaceae bacterium]